MTPQKIEELSMAWNGQVECCGIILLDETIIQLQNRSPNPELTFVLRGSDYEQYRDRMLATWHTHPEGSANLSVADYAMFRSQPQWLHFIVGCGKVWGYKVRASRVLLHETHSIQRSIG